MHRGSSESYISRIGRALDLLQTEFGKRVARPSKPEKTLSMNYIDLLYLLKMVISIAMLLYQRVYITIIYNIYTYIQYRVKVRAPSFEGLVMAPAFELGISR
jgi:hypothetical protein